MKRSGLLITILLTILLASCASNDSQKEIDRLGSADCRSVTMTPIQIRSEAGSQIPSMGMWECNTHVRRVRR